ncbi:hypothetical protein FOA43_001679 [Brettanomyces nanus]|uniref:Adenylate cyclase n=1 Tax=Eeniella nana TaxID=13502 RepID=A0A875S2Q1_EENNA|nr:uncharacterized protein FOA43_001679 [Brettanomyces nanus]QPG74352.1 hypothetical protein FOA43_001679 [Brettanomyces nanus]
MSKNDSSSSSRRSRLFHTNSGFFRTNSQFFSKPKFNSKYVDEDYVEGPRNPSRSREGTPFDSQRSNSTDSSTSPTSSRSPSYDSPTMNGPELASGPSSGAPGAASAGTRSAFKMFFQGATSSRRSSKMSSSSSETNVQGQTPRDSPRISSSTLEPPGDHSADSSKRDSAEEGVNTPEALSSSVPGPSASYTGLHALRTNSEKIVPPLKHPIRPGHKVGRRSTLLSKLMPSRRENDKGGIDMSRASTLPTKQNSAISRLSRRVELHSGHASVSPHPRQKFENLLIPSRSSDTMGHAGHIPSPFGINLDTPEDDMSKITRLSTTTMSRVNSMNTQSNDSNESSKSGWMAPQSWKVRTETLLSPDRSAKNSHSGRTTSLGLSSSSWSSSSSTESLEDLDTPDTSRRTTLSTDPSISSTPGNRRHHHHRMNELKGASRSSVRIFKGDKSSVLPCTLDTTCKDILDTLRRKRFIKTEEDHIIVLKCGGLTRSLSYEEKPLKIQRSLLFMYGYTERDNLDYIERTDLSFLFKFIVQDRGVELISEAKRTLIDPHKVDLDNWNLQDIPNFLYAEPISSLDVSQNPSFEFTKEFMHDCRNLQTLKFTRSGHPTFPTAVVYAPRLSNLDLEVNYIRLIPPEISQLTHLTTLNLACNRISRLPDSFSQLQSLKNLNLSSNRLKQIPNQILSISSLKRLDLSYNLISKLDNGLASLTELEVLQIAANKLTGDLPDFFKDFDYLIKVDIRFNNLSSIESLKDSSKLEVIRATGNNISVFRSNATALFEVEMNLNPLTYVYFESPMPNLKVIDFSKGKLTSCSFVCMLTDVEKLILDYNHLTGLPDDIYKMQKLVHLSLFKNNLNALPDTITKLKRLRYLDLHLNNLGDLNPNIWMMPSLEHLNLSSNLLDSFPPPPERIDVQDDNRNGENEQDITDDKELTNNEKFEDIPEEVSVKSSDISPKTEKFPPKQTRTHTFRLEDSLKFLSINDNNLGDRVIPIISVFHNLEYLNLSYNKIYEIAPGYLSNMHKLKGLYLSGNYLSSLPVDDLDSFGELTTLHLNGNRFHTLPAELYKIHNLTALDVGSNSLKYNISNIPYDWNWSYNKKLQYLNFSGNKRLEIKPQHKHDENDEQLDSFIGLRDLRMLGLMDVTITTDAVPDQSVNVRVRSTSSQIGKFGYGISDTLGNRRVLSTRDVVMEKFRGKSDEMLITIYDGKNCSRTHSDKISKIIQETFDIHLKKELETLESVVIPGNTSKTIEDCLREAFLAMNSEMNILINKDASSTFSSAAAHRTQTTDELSLNEDGYTGCCATIIYIKGDEVYLANLGDTMGILTKSDGEFTVITTKHEPYAPEEYDRIRHSGGYVTTDGYLDGVSEVSRAVGYFKLIPHINAKPSIHKFKLSSKEEMIAIATSDIWKKIPFDLAADIIRQEKSNPGVAAEKLRDFAISYGVRDKATAVVLSLKQFTTKSKNYTRSSQPEDSILRKLDEEIEPPTGEVAMVFTDIKNSTLLWDTYPVAMRSAIKVHNSITRRQMRIIGGYEVKAEGDAFMVSFPTPASALLWCFAVQSQLVGTNEWPAEILSSDQGCEIKDQDSNIIFRGLSVRMGVHWGTPVCERDIVTRRMDYFGPMVNRASRVSAVADGGQITMSNDFYQEFQRLRISHKKIAKGETKIDSLYPSAVIGEIVEGQMQQLEQIEWVEKYIGSKKLKGLEAPERIWLICPKPLKARMEILQTDNKSHKLTSGGVTPANVWSLRQLALRLERICTFLSCDQKDPDPSAHDKFYDGVSHHAESALSSQLARGENVTSVFLEHTITRIENCVVTLFLRKTMAEPGLKKGSVDSLFNEVQALLTESRAIQNDQNKVEEL